MIHSETSLSSLVRATVCGAQKLTHCAGKANTHICRPVVKVMHFFYANRTYFLCDTVHFVEFRPITQIEMNPYENERYCQENVPFTVEKTLKLMTTKVELAAHFSAG